MISSAGVMFLYLAMKLENGMPSFYIVNTYENAFDFHEQVTEAKQEEMDIELFCVLGTNEKTEQIANEITQQIKENFERLSKGKESITSCGRLDRLGASFEKTIMEHIFLPDKVRYPRKDFVEGDEWKLCWFWGGADPDDEGHMLIEDILDIWFQYEEPILMGKQITTQGFRLSELKGRKIMDTSQIDVNGNRMLGLSGELRMRFDSTEPCTREDVERRADDYWTEKDVEKILNNPVYLYGKAFFPPELYDEWYHVFIYALALHKTDWDEHEVQRIYEKFLHFIEENICNVMKADPILDTYLYDRVLFEKSMLLKRFLKGEDVDEISRDNWLFVNSRYMYLPYLYELMDVSLDEIGAVDEEMNAAHLQRFISDSEIKDSYQKGVLWENAVEYFLKHVPGLQVRGKRVKTAAQEIDLSVANCSLDSLLWQMGAYIQVECKNWKKKVEPQVVRELGYLSEIKGSKTTFLFAANGITSGSKAEILRAASYGKYILCITKEDLLQVKNNEECYALLAKKWKELQGGEEHRIML